MNTQDLIALAEKHGAFRILAGDLAFDDSALETFCAALVAVQPKGEEVAIPSNAGQAVLMVLLGTQWLEQHAPERLKADERGSAEPRRKCECEKLPHETHCSWEWPNNPEPGLQEALEEVVGCFEAAEVEGLPEALHLTRDERLKDLFERRVLFAYEAAKAALAATPERAEPASAEDRKVYEAIADNYFKDTQRAEPQGLTRKEYPPYDPSNTMRVVDNARVDGWNDAVAALAARASAGRAKP